MSSLCNAIEDDDDDDDYGLDSMKINTFYRSENGNNEFNDFNQFIFRLKEFTTQRFIF